MLRIAIVEDEEEYIKQLQKYVRRFSDENGQEIEVSVFRDGNEIVANYSPEFDILLLDIEMPILDGLNAARKIRKVDEKVVMMFITNVANYAIHGYEVGALDFITKPLTYYTFQLRFQRAVDRARQRVDDEILLTLRDGVVKVSVRQIYYVEVQNRMLIYHTMNGDYTMRGTMKSVEEQLAKYHFVKCNHWYIVNLSHVERISKDTVTVAGTELEISRRSRTSFLNALTDFMGGAR